MCPLLMKGVEVIVSISGKMNGCSIGHECKAFRLVLLQILIIICIR